MHGWYCKTCNNSTFSPRFDPCECIYFEMSGRCSYAHILYYLVVFLLCKVGRETLHFSWGARYLCSVMLVSKRPCIIVSKMTFELVKRLKDLRGQNWKSLKKSNSFLFFQIYHKWRAQSQIVHGTLCRHVHRNFALRIFHQMWTWSRRSLVFFRFNGR